MKKNEEYKLSGDTTLGLKKAAAAVAGIIAFIFAVIYVFIPCMTIDIFPETIRKPTVDGKIRIEYWEKWMGEELEALQKIVDKFNASQDKVFVDLFPISDVDQRFLVSVAGGNAPDLAGIWTSSIPVYSKMGAIYNMNDLAAKYNIKKEDYVESIWKTCLDGDDLYALPAATSALMLHYNKKLFREAGLDPEKPPRTIKEFDEYAEKLTKYDENGRIKVIGFSPTNPGWWEWAWGWWFGNELWDGGEKININTPQNIEAYTWFQNYSKKYGLEKIQNFESGFGNFSSLQNPFLSEKTAMELNGPWMAGIIYKYNPSLEWGVAPFPSNIDGVENICMVDADVIVIPSDSKNPEAAFQFLAFLQRQDNMEELSLLQKKFSPLKNVTAEFWEKHPHPYIKEFYSMANSPNAKVQPNVSVWRIMMDEMHTAITNIWLQTDTPEHALKIAQERVDQEWKKELAKQKKLMEKRAK